MSPGKARQLARGAALVPEKAFQQAVLDYARLMGWMVYHSHDSRHSAAGFPPETQDAALAVAWCESRFNEGAVGAAGELGQFQIHPVHFPYLRETFGPAVDIASPEVNAWYAYRLSDGGTNWSHWSCRP